MAENGESSTNGIEEEPVQNSSNPLKPSAGQSLADFMTMLEDYTPTVCIRTFLKSNFGIRSFDLKSFDNSEPDLRLMSLF